MANYHLANRIASGLRRTFGGDAGAGVLLMLASTLAMLLANSAYEPQYHALFEAPLAWSPIARLNTLHGWISDGLMALFFFAVGLEIKREIVSGELASAAQRRLPVLAALSGMALPALIFLIIISQGGANLKAGWAVPVATDIAFAVGVLALVGKGLPPALRMFLLTVAIVDDLGAVAIIALVYTSDLSLAWLCGTALCLAAMAVLNRKNNGNGSAYAGIAFLCWLCTLQSGLHPTVAAVAAAMMIPIGLDDKGDSLLLRMEHALVPWNAYFIVPLFGFANAGTHLSSLSGLFASLPLAIAAGLFLGKQSGIFGAVYLAEKLGWAARPLGASWMQLWGMAMLCGIGFTMSLFIAALAFPAQPDLIEQAKIGILAGSLLSALFGYAVLRWSRRS